MTTQLPPPHSAPTFLGIPFPGPMFGACVGCPPVPKHSADFPAVIEPPPLAHPTPTVSVLFLKTWTKAGQGQECPRGWPLGVQSDGAHMSPRTDVYYGP